MSSIAALLQAAEYLERREREVEHGYASSLPGPFHLDESSLSSFTQTKSLTNLASDANGLDNPSSMRRLIKSNSNRKPQGNRSTHNELEKNRRAHLRNCLEKLKDIVPLGGDSSRHTTLGLLNKAKIFIRALEEKERKASSHRENLLREQRYLKRRLELLSTQVDAIHKRRSVSECSTSTVSSSHSSHSESDEHEVDVIGYGGASDDDHSSIRSGTSDGGVTVTTWRQLTIGDAWNHVRSQVSNILPFLERKPFSQSVPRWHLQKNRRRRTTKTRPFSHLKSARKTKKTDTVHVIYNKKNVICPALSSQVYAMKKMANKSVNIFANSRTLRWKKLFFVGRGESNKIIIW